MLFKLLILLCVLLTQEQQVADRIVAIVNGTPILISELNTMENLDVAEQGKRTALERRINQLLILQEVERLNIFRISAVDIANARRSMGRTAGAGESYSMEIADTIDEHQLKRSIEKSLLISRFINYRFRRKIEVLPEDIERYYHGEFKQQYQEENSQRPLPPFRVVSSTIKILLEEQLVTEELNRWLAEQREKAKIVIKF